MCHKVPELEGFGCKGLRHRRLEEGILQLKGVYVCWQILRRRDVGNKGVDPLFLFFSLTCPVRTGGDAR